MKGQARLIVKDKDGNIKNDVTKSNVIFDIPKVIMQNWLNNIDNFGGPTDTYYTSTPFPYITKIQPWFNSIKINDVEISETDYTDWKLPVLYGSTETKSDATNSRYSQRDVTRSKKEISSFTNSWIWGDIPESFDVKSINLFWGYPTNASYYYFGSFYYAQNEVTNKHGIECSPKKISNNVILTRNLFSRYSESEYRTPPRNTNYYKFKNFNCMYQLDNTINLNYNGKSFISENYSNTSSSIYGDFSRFYTISNNRFISLDKYSKDSTNLNLGESYNYLNYITIHPDNSIAKEDIIAQFDIKKFTTDGTTPITTSTYFDGRNQICFLTNNNDTYMYFYHQGKIYVYLLPTEQDDNLQTPIEILNIVDSTSLYGIQMRTIKNYIQLFLRTTSSDTYIRTIELKSDGSHIIYNRGMYNNKTLLWTENTSNTNKYINYQVDMRGEDVDAGSNFPIWYNTTALNLSTPISISAGDTLIVDYTISAE